LFGVERFFCYVPQTWFVGHLGENIMSAAIKPEIENTPVNSDQPLPNSRRIYVDGEQAGVRVPFREISQNQTRNFDNSLADNEPVRVYDTSGPWGDPSLHADVREGLPPLRSSWIVGRGDVEEYEGRERQPIDDGYWKIFLRCAAHPCAPNPAIG
jgi:phosphomethylpyrimidine synthase